MSKERLYIFDTTLRDGAQTQGVDFSIEDKKKLHPRLIILELIILKVVGLVQIQLIQSFFKKNIILKIQS